MRNAIQTFILYFNLIFCASLLLNISGIGMADAMPETGPEKNFIFYVDTSGSMSLSYQEKGPSKISAAMELLHAINAEIPDIAANVGVYTFGPHQEYRRVIPFDRDMLTETFNRIPTDLNFSGRLTPMASGILNLDTTIEALPGSVAFIVVMDGDATTPPPPADVIQGVYDRYGGRICFHFISFAQKPAEKAFVKNLSAINDCSVLAEAVDLLNDAKRADFIERVFK